MSRIGKKPIIIPKGVTITIKGDMLSVKGPKGEEELKLHSAVSVKEADGALNISVANPDEKSERALWGLYRALIANMVRGVVTPFQKKLEMVGVGYKAALQGKKLTLEVGFSHPVIVELPEAVTGTVEKNVITLTGLNRQVVGQIAAKIREFRKPEPYKGKGIKYAGEVIRRKAGKAAKAAGAK